MTTTLVTGATSGIGQALAVALVDAGYDVYAVGRSEAALNKLRSEKSRVVPIALNVTDRDAVEAAVSDLTIDVLVNNACRRSGRSPPWRPPTSTARSRST